MKGKCALFDHESELLRSHIVPKFAFDYMKKTGGKYLRSFEKPNLRQQDGPRDYLLSAEAEAEFSKRERWFVNNVFLPYQKDGKTSFRYRDEFAYFVVSILWRALGHYMKNPSTENEVSRKFLYGVWDEWKMYLSRGIIPSTFNDLNVFLTDRLTSHNTNALNVDLYLSRAIDATVFSNEDNSHVAVYVKFLRFMFWSVIKGESNHCPDTKINFIQGEVTIPQGVKDTFLVSFLTNRIKAIDNRPAVSESQKNIIKNEALQKENDFWQSDAGKSMVNDYTMNSRSSSGEHDVES